MIKRGIKSKHVFLSSNIPGARALRWGMYAHCTASAPRRRRRRRGLFFPRPGNATKEIFVVNTRVFTRARFKPEKRDRIEEV